ncbi:unnamed protein product [Psylliodes chrysocephalus]|uniref:Uncharacterized protein n=1 Tax=Psylliodes chrysocephalus TaxID=3402493 RepID=A0A9P0CC43_9CUCU|nr:unnamed protein product [Psylliodes chrysocephala]
MKGLYFFVSISVLFSLIVGQNDVCGPHEIFNSCGSPCRRESTCQNGNRFPISGGACIALCEPRCECDVRNGWIRSRLNGPCINTSACKRY